MLQLEKLLHSPHTFTLFFIAHFLIEHIFEHVYSVGGKMKDGHPSSSAAPTIAKIIGADATKDGLTLFELDFTSRFLTSLHPSRFYISFWKA